MSNKVKRKVTVENNKDNADHPRRPSVFERLGPGAVSISSQSQDRHSRSEQQEKCRNWLRTGSCAYGNTCRYQHDPYPNSSRRGKAEKEIDEKDLRHKVRNKREENKESRTGSVSPKRKGAKRNGSRSRKGEHESKIKSTVVVTRPRSPTAAKSETEEREKKKPEGSWEDDSDDWPLDAAQLDYKEELTLERKRQQLQRELELELQKERMLNENVTITKTVSFSESSSSSSSSDSGSISSSSDSSSSSSDDDSDDDSSSSSSSSSSSGSRQRSIKRRTKKPQTTKEISSEKSTDNSSHQKPRDDYDKIKSSRAAKCSGARVPSPCPSPDLKSRKGGRDKRNITPPPVPSPKRRSCHEPSNSGSNRGNTNVKTRGPRTPSPPISRKQRQWDQSSSADSRSTDFRRNRGKQHKKKRDARRNEKYKSNRASTPPPLSSPNRTAVPPNAQYAKKSRQRGNTDDSYLKPRQRGRESSPLLLTRPPVHSSSPNVRLLGSHRNYSPEQEKASDKQRQSLDCSKPSLKKSLEDISSRNKRSVSRDRPLKRARASPRKDTHKESISPLRDKMEVDGLLGGPGRKIYSSPLPHVEKLDDRNDRRKRSTSPAKGKEQRDRRKTFSEIEKKREPRDISPRNNRDNLCRDNLHRNNDTQNYIKKDNEIRGKRGLTPEIKKGRDDKNRERNQRERNNEHETLAWNDEHKKVVAPIPPTRITEPRSRQELQALQPVSSTRRERSRESERDRKKVKERDISLRTVDEVDRERQRLPSPIRSQSPLRAHHPIREVEAPLPVRSRIYDPEIPTSDREYAYGYETREAMYMSERLLPPEYDTAILRGPPLYGSDMYPDPRYRRDPTLKDPGPIQHLDRIGSYSGRDMLSSRDMLPPRDVMGIQGRNDDYLAELPVDDRHAYDERWSRSRPLREEWDPYAALPPGPLPVHLAPVLDEDRYGMPRRRRAGSTEWQLTRADERELPPSPIGHRQPPTLPPLPLAPREQRTSRSPQPKRIADIAPANRGPWEHNNRHGTRTNDNRHENQQRNQDEKKVRGRREHRDRGRRREVPSNDPKTQPNSKQNNKRPHSSSPSSKESKKRKEEMTPSEPVAAMDKGSSKVLTPKQEYSLDALSDEFQRYRLDKLGVQETRCTGILPTSKRIHDEPKSEQKVPVTGRSHKPSKSEPSSPKSSTNSRSSTQEKVEAPPKNSHAIKIPPKPEKEEKKVRRNNDEKTQVDDDFSDWSDGDDDLLNRDDFNECEVSNETENLKIKDEESQDNKSCKHITNSADLVTTIDDGSRHPKDTSQELRQKLKETASQSLIKNENKESVNENISQTSKDPEPAQDTKEIESIDSFMVKDETDMDGYITTESVDYDPISDDELETPLEDIDDALMKPNDQGENSRIADALDVNWSTLMSESRSKTDFVPGLARRQFKTVHVLSRIGFSQALAGPELTEKIFNYCQQQLDEECGKQSESMSNEEERKKFTMEHQIAAFHVAISESKKERTNILSNLGPYRRALCARRDLQIRKQLCKPTNKLFDPVPAMYSQQHNVDKDLYKQSLELLKQKKSEYVAQTINVAC